MSQRVARLVCVAFGIMLPAASANVQRPEVERQLAAVFDQAVKEHAFATEALAWLKPGQTEVVSSLNSGRQIAKHAPFYGWSLRGIGALESGPTLYQSEAMEDFVKGLRATGRGDEAAVCLKFAQAYLNHADPRYRAVACEFLAHFPLQVIDAGLLPAVAQRLGDSALAFDGATFGCDQRAGYIHVTRCANSVSVGDVAREALVCGTGFQFQDAKAFDVWWQGNKDCRHRLWYWAMRWERLPIAPPTPPAADPSKTPVVTHTGKVSVETEFPALVAAVGPEEGLKTLLLAPNPRAVATQSGARWGLGGASEVDTCRGRPHLARFSSTVHRAERNCEVCPTTFAQAASLGGLAAGPALVGGRCQRLQSSILRDRGVEDRSREIGRGGHRAGAGSSERPP